jgi:hypothetical protein
MNVSGHFLASGVRKSIGGRNSSTSFSTPSGVMVGSVGECPRVPFGLLRPAVEAARAVSVVDFRCLHHHASPL